MTHKQTILVTLLSVVLLANIPVPSSGFGMFKRRGSGGGGGGGGGSSVAEILAAGLITGLLMDNRPMARPMMHALRIPLMMPHGMMHHGPMHHGPMHHMMPMMTPYAMPTMHRPRFHMNPHALMAQASRHHALTARLNQEIQALEAQESVLEAMLARNQHGGEPNLDQLLNEQDSIPAAALLLETADLVDAESNLDKSIPMPHPEMFQTAASEHESRYILPRIVRHFVQRLMRRGENH